MSQDFEKVWVQDDRLDCKQTIKYGVCTGGMNVTTSTYKANSSSTDTISWNIQVPSEQTVVDRAVLWKSGVELTITGTNTDPDNVQDLFKYGSTDALGPMPLHQMCSVQQFTINNNTVSQNTQDVLLPILQMVKRKQMLKYHGYAPSALDCYSDYSQCVGANNNSLGSFNNAMDTDYCPRGAYPLDFCIDITDDNNAPSVKGQFDSVELGKAGSGNETKTFKIGFTCSEPVLMSPFIFAHPQSNNQGFYGIQNMNAVFNLKGANRVWRRASVSGNEKISNFAVSIRNIINPELIFNFLTPHSFDLFPSRNTVGYWEMPRYITNVQTPELVKFQNVPTAKGYKWSASKVTVSSDTIQLNQIPDTLILFVRKPLSDQKVTDPDFFYRINGVRVDFNNQSGLMTSVTRNELYNMCADNGSSQSWREFDGYCNLNTGASNVVSSITSSGNSGANIVGTSGSMLVLKMGKDIQLSESYYAPGSLGNFSLRVSLEVENQTAQDAPKVELVLVTMLSGLYCLERGTSSIYTGILLKSDILDTINNQKPYARSDVARIVGGSLSGLTRALGSLPAMAKAVVGSKPVQAFCKFGKPESVSTGAGMVGAGRRKKIDERCM